MAGKDNESKESKEGEKPELSVPPPTRKSIILKNLLYVLLVGLIIVGTLGYLSFDPQDLSDVEGYEPNPIPPVSRWEGVILVLCSRMRRRTSVRFVSRKKS